MSDPDSNCFLRLTFFWMGIARWGFGGFIGLGNTLFMRLDGEGHLSLGLGYLSLSAVIDCIVKFIALGDFDSVELFVGMNVVPLGVGKTWFCYILGTAGGIKMGDRKSVV